MKTCSKERHNTSFLAGARWATEKKMRAVVGSTDLLEKGGGVRMNREVGQMDRAMDVDPERHQKVKLSRKRSYLAGIIGVDRKSHKW